MSKIVEEIRPEVLFMNGGQIIKCLGIPLVQEGFVHPNPSVVVTERRGGVFERVVNLFGGYPVLFRGYDGNGNCRDRLFQAKVLRKVFSYADEAKDCLAVWASPSLRLVMSNGTPAAWNLDPVLALRPPRNGEPAPPYHPARLLAGLRARFEVARTGVEMPDLYIVPLEHIMDGARVVRNKMERLLRYWEELDPVHWGIADEILAWIDSGAVRFRVAMIDRLVPDSFYAFDKDSGRIKINVCISSADLAQIAINFPDFIANPLASVAEDYGMLAIEYQEGDEKFFDHRYVRYVSHQEVLRLQQQKYIDVNALRQELAAFAHLLCPNRHPLTELFWAVMQCPHCRPMAKRLLEEELCPAVEFLTGAPCAFAPKILDRLDDRRFSNPMGKTVSYQGIERTLFADRVRWAFEPYVQKFGVQPPLMSAIMRAVGVDPDSMV